ncbi:thioesterase domain-containing protein [Micromonospora peucetia]|uniref:Thioesterase domain-containing protein n=2 Tax=Micromonospora peucetia TaxID=47871 RepID=A0ABZ1EJA6_9ACTN|nr:thioesterase domain-containing protein [Micromonospora peucetia]WSA34342.1 thioesterase domain-containing protein [Micromonospora peucetia]
MSNEFADYATVGSQMVVAEAMGLLQLPPTNVTLGDLGIIGAEWERIQRDLFEIFHLRVDPTALSVLTPAQLGQFIADQPINRPGPQLRLADGSGTATWLVHGADGEVSWFLKHLDGIGLPTPLIGLRAPGWYDEPTPASIEELAARYSDQVRAAQPTGPYRLAGYCAGAVIAVAMANLLESQGETVERMFFIDPDLRHEPASRRDAVMFRLHQLKRRPEPAARLLRKPATETTLAQVLERMADPRPHQDPVERVLYRGLGVVADMIGLTGGDTLTPVASTATAWFTDSYLTSIAESKDKVMAHLATMFSGGVDIRYSPSHTEIFATTEFRDWLIQYAAAETHNAAR